MNKKELEVLSILATQYTYELVQYIDDASQYETELQNKFKAYQYSPRISFSGKYECFTPEILEILNDN